MTWNIGHNFPGAKDTYTTPVDYPDFGYDTVLASWFTDIFTSILAIQDALGYDITGAFADLATRLSGRIFHTRIVGNTPDFDGNDFTTDGNEHTLDLSGIIPVGTKAVLLNGTFWSVDATIPGLCGFYPSEIVGFWSVGDGIELCFSIDPGFNSYAPFNVIIPVNGDREIKYILDISGGLIVAWTRLSVTGWFK